ncbi:hypothetical protein SteCoe_21522 [Stentor coeruleus]|uniref:Rab-GAP TBC domain-containing protein n=1 Tax=Stentor coeruleus TaxID=5963 RepID=A0A1R2BP91_9CILI|nr:hypothetical protein SteCoe_21522 [Stentor coeruleus]
MTSCTLYPNNWKQMRLIKLLYKTPQEEFSIITDLNLPNQQVIKCDVERTRSDEITSEEKFLLENMLTLYCKQTSISYKQGMNEILVPFLVLCRYGMPYYIAYTCFKEFINSCLKTMFQDETFRPLQGWFIIMNLLLKYHSPKISNFLQDHDITPELYTTSWFLTMYATKVTSLNYLFILWENIILENDYIFPCFVAVSLIDKFQEGILGQEYAFIPLALNKIAINSYEELQQVLDKSQQIKSFLPISIAAKLKNYDIYNLKSIDSYTQALSKTSCLSILPREIMHLAYPEVKLCNCQKGCKMCRNSYPVIIIDCRCSRQQKQGYFPNTEFFDGNINDPKCIEQFPLKFFNIRGVYHFALLGSEDIKHDNYGQNSQNIVTKLLKSFWQKEFQYVSVVEGGYNSCHEFALDYNLEIKDHISSSCLLCCKLKKIISKKDVSKSMKKLNTEIREKCRTNSTIKVFECKKYNLKIGIVQEDMLNLIVGPDTIMITDRDSHIIDRYLIKDLNKIANSQDLSAILTFNFHTIKEKISYSFANSKKAKSCLKKVTTVFRSLKNEIIKGLI